MKARYKKEAAPVKFEIESLEDLGKHFDRMADKLVQQAETPGSNGKPLPKMRVLSLLAEAYGFRNAAKMARNCKLRED